MMPVVNVRDIASRNNNRMRLDIQQNFVNVQGRDYDVHLINALRLPKASKNDAEIYSLQTEILIFTACKRRLGQGNVFTPVCQSFCSRGGCLPHCMLGYVPRQTLLPDRPLPSRQTSPSR